MYSLYYSDDLCFLDLMASLFKTFPILFWKACLNENMVGIELMVESLACDRFV